ncbi:MAG: response regulator [Xanthomonadales bacterium]|nr:response regulator [Xanthomonadales bacterium]
MSKKILIVDDSPAELANLRTLLTDAGYHTITATNGREAVAKAAAEMPALIFMDVVMPDMDGYEACRQLRAGETTKGIPVVVVSSKSQKADQLWATMQGAKAVIGKPAKAEDVMAAVQAYA